MKIKIPKQEIFTLAIYLTVAVVVGLIIRKWVLPIHVKVTNGL